jgi:microcystin-dependent protein
MSCTNCYNGCAEIVSDQCVKYTGVDVPLLGIQNGDTLATVESAIISFVTPFLNGTGIKPIIDPDIICDVVRQYIPTCVECNGFNLNDILTAIIKAVCDLQIQINNVVADIAIIEADYEVGCIEEVSASSGTHDILQAVINTLCQVQVDLAALSLDVATNYIRIDQINDYIAAYLAALPSDLVSAKMIPYVALEFYGDLIGKFDVNGAGYGVWKDIYLCNGSSHPQAPDKRGRVAVCAIVDMGGGALDPEVDPNQSQYNPLYEIDYPDGSNFTTLNKNQMPLHTHTPTVVLNDPGHAHLFGGDDFITQGGYTSNGTGFNYDAQSQNSGNGKNYYTKNLNGTGNGIAQSSNVTIASATNSDEGGGLPHSNVQPVYPCYYIIYIPA